MLLRGGIWLEGNKDWDTFTNSGAEEGLPEGKVPAVCVVPRPDTAKKPQVMALHGILRVYAQHREHQPLY